jgi:hypothetical protein
VRVNAQVLACRAAREVAPIWRTPDAEEDAEADCRTLEDQIASRIRALPYSSQRDMPDVRYEVEEGERSWWAVPRVWIEPEEDRARSHREALSASWSESEKALSRLRDGKGLWADPFLWRRVRRHRTAVAIVAGAFGVSAVLAFIGVGASVGVAAEHMPGTGGSVGARA